MEAVQISLVFLCLIAACAISNEKSPEQDEIDREIELLLKCEVEATDPAKECAKPPAKTKSHPRKKN